MIKLINLLKEAKNKYEISGDRYDGGVDCIVYVNGKKVFKGWTAGDHDWTYKKKDYDTLDKMLDQIAKDNGLQSHKDFKRKEI